MILLFKSLFKNTLYSKIVIFICLISMMASMHFFLLLQSNKTILQRVEEINGAHLNLYICEEGYNTLNVNKYIDIYEIDSNLYSKMERTYAFPYNKGDKSHDIYFEGYVSSDTNNYEVLQGKQLSKLKYNEVAVSYSYAQKLLAKNIEPMDYEIVYETSVGDEIVFVIKSIIDYPNYNESRYSANDVSKIPFFESKIVDVGIGNFNKIMNLSSTYSLIDYSICAEVYKFHIDDYTIYKEQRLVENILNLSYGTDFELLKVSPIYEELNTESFALELFKYLSILIFILIHIACFTALFVILNKQIIADKNKILLLNKIGVSNGMISIVYLLKCLFLAILALIGYYIYSEICNVIPYYIVSILQLCFIFIGLYMIVSLSFFKLTSKKNRLDTSKYDKPLTNENLIHSLAIRSIIHNYQRSCLIIFSVFIICISLVVSVYSYYICANPFSKNTLGLNFDYVIQDIKYSDYKQIESVTNNVIVERINDIYFCDIDYSENTRSYYKSSLLLFKNKMEGFVNLHKGNLPISFDNTRPVNENRTFYETAVITKKEQLLRDAVIFHQNIDENSDIEKRYISYSIATYKHGTLLNRETFKRISGTYNSLIDKGSIVLSMEYVTSTSYKDDQLVDVMLFVTDDMSEDDLIDRFNQMNIDYYSMDDILNIMNENNSLINKQTFIVLSVACAILSLICIMSLIEILKTIYKEHEKDFILFKKLGLNEKLILNKKIILECLYLIAISIVLTIIAFTLFSYKLYSDICDLFYLYTMDNPFIFVLLILILVLIVIIAIIHIVKHNDKNTVNKL